MGQQSPHVRIRCAQIEKRLALQKAQSDWHRAQTILQSVGDVSVGVDARSLSEIVEDVEFNELHVLARFWARVTSVRLSGLRVQNTIQVGLTNSFPQIFY